MRFTTKTLGQLHITTSNMPTPPTSETFVSVKRDANQKVYKTRKKRRVEKLRSLSSIHKEEGDGSLQNMEDDEAHSPPALELFQQVVELARKVVQDVAGENEEQLQKEDEVVEEEIVQDQAITQMEYDEIPQDSQKIDSAGDASLQKEVENVAQKEHQKVNTSQNVKENPHDLDQRVEENTEQAAQKVVEVTQEVAEDQYTQEVAEIFASQMMSQGNAQVQDHGHMKFSTGFYLNIEDINTDFNEELFQDGQETI